MRLLTITFVAVLAAPAAHAGTIVVGLCKAGTHLSTIQAAVDASAPTGIISICPGTYPEQVVISHKNLTLNGLVIGNSSQALIVPPPGGVVVNTTYLGSSFPVAAQILVQNATVTLNNLTVDGAGNAISGCSPDLVGMLYQNASGTIKASLLRNQFIAPYASLGGCQSGEGIFVESDTGTSNVSIQNNTVQAFQKNAVTGTNVGTKVTLNSNTLYGFGPTAGAAQNGVQISFGATGSVLNNVVGDEVYSPDQFGDTGNAASGILVYDSANVSIKGNVVSSTQYGIVVVGDGQQSADGAQIANNTVSRTYLYDAVDLCGSSNATVTGNSLQGNDEAGVHLDSSCGIPSTGSSVTKNTIVGSCAAILEGTGSSGSVSTITYFDDAALLLTGSDICPAAPTAAAVARVRHPLPVKH